MATEVKAAKFKDVRQAAASKGLSLDTNVARQAIPVGTEFIQIIGTTYSTAVVARFLLNPWLTIIKTTDLLADPANMTDYSYAAQDNDTGTSVVLSSLGTLAQSDALYVGSHEKFAGVALDVDGTNSNASVLTVTYWNGSAWTDISATDGSDSGGASVGADGVVSWTVPAAWTTTRLDAAVATAAKNQGVLGRELYWTRWVWSAALDASVTVDHMLAVNKSTAYCELPASLPWEQGILCGPGGVSSIAALADAGTALLIINCATSGRFA